MDKRQFNDWEAPIDYAKCKDSKNYNLEDIYDHAHSELSLQQNKRDQIITIYLALCSFLLPFALGEAIESIRLKGLIFLVVGIVGILFSLITVRYREYKEVYWLCCQSITVLQSFKPEEIDKSVVQRTFYHCLRKKGKAFLSFDGDTAKLKKLTFVKKNLYSSETLHFMIIDLMASFIMGLGTALIINVSLLLNILIGALVGITVFILLFSTYFRTGLKIYASLETKNEENNDKTRNKAFNKAFSKAWFLHFYYDNKN